MNTYNEALLLRVEKTLVIMGYGHIHPKRVLTLWDKNPPSENEPWEMRVRSSLDLLGANNKKIRLPKKKRPTLLYRESKEAPVQILAEK
jgi:hypothetical protein